MILDAEDNVAIAVMDLAANEVFEVGNEKIILKNDIKFGHKFSIKPIKKGDFIMKYGEVIGVAVKDISCGELVHVHNIKSLKGGKNGKK